MSYLEKGENVLKRQNNQPIISLIRFEYISIYSYPLSYNELELICYKLKHKHSLILSVKFLEIHVSCQFCPNLHINNKNALIFIIIRPIVLMFFLLATNCLRFYLLL